MLVIAGVTDSRYIHLSAAHFLGHCFGLIPAPGSFAASAFPVPPEQPGSLPQSSRSLWEQKPLAFGCPKKMGHKRRFKNVVPQFSDPRGIRRC